MVGKAMDIMKIRPEQLVKQQGALALWCLPVEILCHIFVHCLPETDRLKVSPELAPTLLTRICRQWREVAVNMPALWCRFCIIFHPHHGTPRAWKKEAFCYDLWLKRSQECQLSLTIDCLPNDTVKLRGLLHPYNTQISSLQLLSGNAATAAEPLLQVIPALRELVLHGLGIDRIARLIPRLPCTLRNLKFNGSGVDAFESFSACSVWAHLTNLDTPVNRPHEFLHLLDLCPNLSSVDIILNCQGAVIQLLQPCRHANLQYLSIKCSIPCPLPDLLEALTLPSLRVLLAVHHPGWPHEALKAFLARSKCPLERLTFGPGKEATDDPEQRAEYIALIPSLSRVLDTKRRG
jgi:hypothetical protein